MAFSSFIHERRLTLPLARKTPAAMSSSRPTFSLSDSPLGSRLSRCSLVRLPHPTLHGEPKLTHCAAYFEGVADIEANTSKELTKLGAVIQVPFRPGNQFLGEGGMQVSPVYS